jgi:peroxiredoxin
VDASSQREVTVSTQTFDEGPFRGLLARFLLVVDPNGAVRVEQSVEPVVDCSVLEE